MNSSIVISLVDQARLNCLLNHECPGPWLDPSQQATLCALLADSLVTDDEGRLDGRIGLYDKVTLVSPKDSGDYFDLRIVLPREADLDREMISIAMPVSLALLGRHCGESVAWATPAGLREMRVVAVRKAVETLTG